VWDWGDFWRYFEDIADVNIAESTPTPVDSVVHHRPLHTHPSSLHEVDITIGSVELHSAYVFWNRGEPPIGIKEVLPYIPRLQPKLQMVVDEFARDNLRDAVGLHIRRTDCRESIARSPDSVFLERAAEVVKAGKKIFLATDNRATVRQMCDVFGDSIVTFPKRHDLVQRWPRAFDPVALEDDLIDLFLLARTEYVLGSYWSSFSELAMVLNGSSRSKILKKLAPSSRFATDIGCHRSSDDTSA
jgi:hypothetical protein